MESISQLQSRLRTGKTSAALAAQAALKAAKSDKQRAFVSLAEGYAAQSAAEADKRLAKKDESPLLGVPIAVKDNICMKGERMTCGSKILDNFVSPFDAFAITKIKQAGGVIIGKTNLNEFGADGESAYGGAEFLDKPISDGGAVAVASGIVYGALGTDTGGSARRSAARCGVVCLKPSYSTVSRAGLTALGSSLDQISPIARSVTDVEVLFNAIKGVDAADATSTSRDDGETLSSVKDKKIGYLDIGCKAVIAAKERFSALGAELVPLQLKTLDIALAAYQIICCAEATTNLARYDGIKYGSRASGAKTYNEIYYKTRSEFLGSDVKQKIIFGNLSLSAGYYNDLFLRAGKARTLVMRELRQALSELKGLILPIEPKEEFSGALAFKADKYTAPVSLAGLPALVLNGGEGGIQLVGNMYAERTLLSLGRIYEEGR